MTNFSCIILFLAITATAGILQSNPVQAENQEDYGADVSFAVHRGMSEQAVLGPERKKVYADYIQGCRDSYDDGKEHKKCDQTEDERLRMSIRQPQSMVNYTDTGYKKVRAPEPLFRLLRQFWEKNKVHQSAEKWAAGNIYTNHWKSPTYITSIEDRKLHGGGYKLKKALWDAAQETLEEWTGMEQEGISLYGIRTYKEGSILSPHVDRLPLVSSCIINVDQDVDEDWPIEVYNREGKAVNITMEPGDMVLYESGSLIHGRPFELKGRFFANIFIHFEPTGRTIAERDAGMEVELPDDLPPYIIRGSPEESHWKSENPNGWKNRSPSISKVQESKPEGHAAAATGDMKTLERIAKEQKSLLHLHDKNGWQPIHEAARGGHVDITKLLVSHGANIHERSGYGSGGTPLYLSIHSNGKLHPLSKYLEGLGALNAGPEL